MDDIVIDKIKSFFTTSGYDGDVNKIDFSFLIENKEFVAFVMNISEDNYVSKHDLDMISSYKKEDKYIEYEERIDRILLQEYGCNVNGECVNEWNVLTLKDKVKEMDNNIELLDKLNDLSMLQYKNMERNIKKTKEHLKDEESKLNYKTADYVNYDHKFISLVNDVNKEYKSYKDMFEQNFLNKKPGNGQVLFSSLDCYKEFDIFKKKVKKYVNSCHRHSAIPVSVMNTTVSSCDSTFCNSLPQESDLTNLRFELSKLKVSLNKKIYNRLLLEAEKEALTWCLQFLKEKSKADNFQLFLLDQNNIYLHESEDEDDDDDSFVEHVRDDCLKWAECQITRVLNYLYESKVSKRNMKLLALDNFLKIVQRCCAIIDLLWMIFKSKSEFFEHYNSTLTSLIACLNDEFESYLKRKGDIEIIVQQSGPKLLSMINPTMEYAQSLLLPSNCIIDEAKIMNASKDLMKNVNIAEERLLKSSRDTIANSVERYKECMTLERSVFNNCTGTNVNFNDINLQNFKDDIKSYIDELTDKIATETSLCILKKENLAQNYFLKQLHFLWVTFLTEPEKLKNMLEE